MAWEAWTNSGPEFGFHTLKHSVTNCGNGLCNTSQEAYQGCKRMSGTTTTSHNTEIKLREDDVERAHDFYSHTHTSSNNTVLQEERSPLVFEKIDTVQSHEYKFQVYVYWPDGTYRTHVTTILQ